MKSALILIDIQQDYFEGGRNPLEGSLEASQMASTLLAHFRSMLYPVVHIRHISQEPDAAFFAAGTPGVKFHPNSIPQDGEIIIDKHFPNSFLETGLNDILQGLKIERLVLAGMMTHMCVDATVRSASDLGFNCWLAHDACATQSLIFDGKTVPARQVHLAFLAALQDGYARVLPCSQILTELSREE